MMEYWQIRNMTIDLYHDDSVKEFKIIEGYDVTKECPYIAPAKIIIVNDNYKRINLPEYQGKFSKPSNPKK